MSGGSWRIEGDELVYEAKNLGWVWFGDPMWSDYDASMEVSRDADGEGIGVAVRAIDNQNLQVFRIGAEKNTAHMARFSHPGQKEAVVQARVPGKIEANQWYAVRIEVRGQRFRYLLDGKEVLAFEDPRCIRGGIALLSYFTSARFRDIRVSDPSGRVLWAGPPRLGLGAAVELRRECELLRLQIADLEGRPLPAPASPTITDFRELHGADASRLREWLGRIPTGRVVRAGRRQTTPFRCLGRRRRRAV